MKNPLNSIDKDDVIRKAFLRAAENLDLSGADLEKITGYSESTISRMKDGSMPTDRKKRELVVGFLRLYRSLIPLAGDVGNAKEWLHSENSDLGGRPFDLIQTFMGLADVTTYLDAMRGKI